MKKTIIALSAIAALALPMLLSTTVLVSSTGCTTTSTVTNGVTNVVTTLDPVKLQQAKAAIEPAASSVLRRAILNSPQHAVEIGNYARAVGGVFCSMSKNQNFSPSYLITALNDATGSLQAQAPPEIIDAKNAAVALYQIFFADKLTADLPNNAWPHAVCQLFCDSINQALLDAKQPGI